MRKLTLIEKFSFLCLFSLLLLGIVFGLIVNNFLEQNMLIRSKQITASIVSKVVRNDFIEPKIGTNYNVFAGKNKRLPIGPNVERIKIWNRDKVVVWAYDKELVGQHFPDNEDLIEALSGELTSEISFLKKGEHKFERKFGRLLELYVPISLKNNGYVDVVYV